MAAYALFYPLTRIPAVNTAFAYTTLTRAYLPEMSRAGYGGKGAMR